MSLSHTHLGATCCFCPPFSPVLPLCFPLLAVPRQRFGWLFVCCPALLPDNPINCNSNGSLDPMQQSQCNRAESKTKGKLIYAIRNGGCPVSLSLCVLRARVLNNVLLHWVAEFMQLITLRSVSRKSRLRRRYLVKECVFVVDNFCF